jgi:membrane-associated protease RseP (regulator of RpoE activity)
MDLTGQLGDYFGVEKGKGALITEVHKDSPAEKAGLKAGDVIVAVDDEKVVDADDVSELIEDHKPGDTAGVTVVRDKKEVTIAVEVDETEEESFGYHYGHPYAPEISMWMPEIKKLVPPRLPHPDEEFDFERDDFQGEFDDFKTDMKEFKKDMENLKKEMQELREKLK